MKLIKLCGECADYDKKKHRCRRGANREDDPRNTFYDDCPMQDFEEFLNRLSTRLANNADIPTAVLYFVMVDIETTKREITEGEE